MASTAKHVRSALLHILVGGALLSPVSVFAQASNAGKPDTNAPTNRQDQDTSLKNEEKANKQRAKADHEQRKALRAQDKAAKAQKKADGVQPQN